MEVGSSKGERNPTEARFVAWPETKTSWRTIGSWKGTFTLENVSKNWIQEKRKLAEEAEKAEKREKSKPKMDLSSLGMLEEKMREIERVRKEKEEQRKKEKEWERQEKIKNQETFTYQTNDAFER